MQEAVLFWINWLYSWFSRISYFAIDSDSSSYLNFKPCDVRILPNVTYESLRAAAKNCAMCSVMIPFASRKRSSRQASWKGPTMTLRYESILHKIQELGENSTSFTEAYLPNGWYKHMATGLTRHWWTKLKVWWWNMLHIIKYGSFLINSEGIITFLKVS